jgi:glycerol uptake facilitator-like aquaporin
MLSGLPISAPLNFGLTVMFVIGMFGHISFAIINPAVAVAAVVHKLISIKVRKLNFYPKNIFNHFF